MVARVSNDSRASTSVSTRPSISWRMRAPKATSTWSSRWPAARRALRTRRFDQRAVLRLLCRLQNQRWIGRGVTRPQPLDRRQVTGVGDDRRMALQASSSDGMTR